MQKLVFLLNPAANLAIRQVEETGSGLLEAAAAPISKCAAAFQGKQAQPALAELEPDPTGALGELVLGGPSRHSPGCCRPLPRL